MQDEIKIAVIAGNGGNGGVSLRREKYVPRGGPDGGDGGRGGDVVLVVDTQVRLLGRLQRRKIVRAGNGQNGGPANKHGKDGEAAILKVPAGTLVFKGEEEEPAVDLSTDEQRVVLVRGGSGGKGNARLATSTRRTPRFAERGLPGEKAKVRLELRLLADVGLVGLPNAGKSSLLRAMSAARPKVGAYPFTTLEPNIGVVEHNYETLVAADIPGLIEGAHEGAGLGTRFLRHIGRTAVLLHIVDAGSADVVRDIEAVRGELAAYGEGLAAKPWLIALNKIDLPEVRDQLEELRRSVKEPGVDVYAISALSGEGVPELIGTLFKAVQREREAEAARVPVAKEAVIRPRPAVDINVRRVGGGFRLLGDRPREAALRLAGGGEEANAELARRLDRMGAVAALRRAGAETGDLVLVGEVELVWPL